MLIIKKYHYKTINIYAMYDENMIKFCVICNNMMTKYHQKVIIISIKFKIFKKIIKFRTGGFKW
ncbi:hypothetical protein ADU90_04220 [Clostridium botulinum]|uniref:Uncharacterized protein n=1 Tax=Clostridium botulinum C/D str. DC5 TaxID=1443128 RepID=A0A0A0II75_CLOBO|nr:hypothetical protein Z955_05135 [Clostridium botulinum C/D str. DC5]KOC56081.1 hypothetical protein ADU89_04115 [Clostridium botulinum]KOC57711.1 hypothetical protein ADU90_04220 [Clostridium botulinum]